MGFLVKFIAKIILNGIALYVAARYLDGFTLTGGFATLAIASLVLTVLNIFIRPILKLVTLPLVWLTFGLFNIVINMAILWVADQLLTQLTIADIPTLFWTSIIIALANIFF
jgi:putative membrane protein